MSELFTLKVFFIDDTELEVSDVKDTKGTAEQGFFRAIKNDDSEWIVFHDKIKYHVWIPQSSASKARKQE